MSSISSSDIRPGDARQPEWLVSYAWRDDTDAGRALDRVVDDICAAAEQRGLRILRDRDELGLGDSISAFMRRIGEGDRVFVVLSAKYLRSAYCMFELFEVWQNCRGRERDFLDRIRVFVLPDAKISTALDRSDHAIFWQDEHDKLEARIRERPASVGRKGYDTYHQMSRFYYDLADILTLIADIVQPRTLEQFERYGFDYPKKDADDRKTSDVAGPLPAPIVPPLSPAVAWPDDSGEDEYGKWVSFSVTAADGSRVMQRLRWCPEGRFMMGSPEGEDGRFEHEGPRHEVVFARGFWMFETACRQELWLAVMGDKPSSKEGPMLPVTNVSWVDARRFIARLNSAKPGIGIDLPSEAQWEYACRAGTETSYSFGPKISRDLVNYSGQGPVPVGSLPPNGWGLYEMQGNVQEWCTDRWDGGYNKAPVAASPWIGRNVEADRVVRGGSWLDPDQYVRAACREARLSAYRSHDVGFRCARVERDS